MGDMVTRAAVHLTPREDEILTIIWRRGCTLRQCARRLGMNPRTAASHMSNIHRKTRTHNVAQLFQWARKEHRV